MLANLKMFQSALLATSLFQSRFFLFQICFVTMPSHHRPFPRLMSDAEYQKKWDYLRAVVDQLLHDPSRSSSHIVSFEEMYRNESETSFTLPV